MEIFPILNGENYLWSLFFNKKSKRFWKKLMETIPCRCFFQKKIKNVSEKHLNGEISIQNGDFSILNGEKYL